MKPPKNRLKLLRVACGMCKSQQDSLNAACAHCGHPLYTNMTSAELEAIRTKVDALESCLQRIENGQTDRKDPYKDHDDVKKLIKDLKAFSFMPGMPAFLSAARLVQLPYQILVMERTVRANLVFSLILLGFASLPILLDWPFSVVGLMLLPATFWIGITLKAWFSLRKAVAEVKS